jgi:hypothetical protein
MFKVLHFLGTLTYFDCLGTLVFHKINKIHYLIWGLKTKVLHSPPPPHPPPPYFDTILDAYTKNKSKFQNSLKGCGYSLHITSSCSKVASLGP